MDFTDVVLDSSAIFLGRPFREVNAMYLGHFSRQDRANVWIPRVVLQECKTLIAESAEQAQATLLTTMRSLDDLGVSPGFLFGDLEFKERAVNSFLENVSMAGAKILELPKALGHEVVLERLQAGRKPFRGVAGKRDVGYRDCLIWESLLSLGTPSETRIVAFITANKHDFASGDDENPKLHAELEGEAIGRNLSVSLFPSLNDFISSVIRPNLRLTDQVRALLDTTKWIDSLSTWLEKELPSATLGVSVESFEWHGTDVGSAAIADYAGFDFVEVLNVNQVEKDIVAEVKCRFGALVGFQLSPEDAVKLEAHWSQLDGWDENRYRGELGMAMIGTFEVLLETDDRDNIEFKSLRLASVEIDWRRPYLD